MLKRVAILWLVLFSVQVNAGLIAQFDGSIHISTSMYINGYGSAGESNFVDGSEINNLNALGDDVIIKLTMGSFVDYFKPVAGANLESMLTSNNLHLWSSAEDGTFIAPDYYTSHLGGSAHGFPGDGRTYLSFWGGGDNRPDLLGGCCSDISVVNQSWGRGFTIESVDIDMGNDNSGDVPAPAPLALIGLGLLGMVLRKKRM